MKVRKRTILLFLLPATILYIVFFLFPAVWAFYFSVFDWSGFGEAKAFIGLGNFLELMRDDLFKTSINNTLKILFIGGFVTLAVAFLMTILFSSKIRGRKFFRGGAVFRRRGGRDRGEFFPGPVRKRPVEFEPDQVFPEVRSVIPPVDQNDQEEVNRHRENKERGQGVELNPSPGTGYNLHLK